MKRVLILFFLLGIVTFSYGQYSKEKITDILTGGSSKAWTAKTGGDTYTFNKDMSVAIKKGVAAQSVKWSLNSTDNIRWFITLGKETHEIIVSYDKAGKQFVKLTKKAENNKPAHEVILYPAQ